MIRIPSVPPIKCQGIKTKLVPAIKRIAEQRKYFRWVEPFCGSCVIALNVQPKNALLCDTNPHIIKFYQEIQAGKINPSEVKTFLKAEGEKLKAIGEPYYYEVRERFNQSFDPMDFLFLNRSCFNGIIRFNKKGKFNVPYCHKPERFSPSYVTKIANQVRKIAQVLSAVDWTFEVADFRTTLAKLGAGDFVYADPPYAGRHVDYFNSWSDKDEEVLASSLCTSKCQFLLSTWHSNEFRTNSAISSIWETRRFHVLTREHFYHVGASEELRHPMIEALITNFPLDKEEEKIIASQQTELFAF